MHFPRSSTACGRSKPSSMPTYLRAFSRSSHIGGKYDVSVFGGDGQRLTGTLDRRDPGLAINGGDVALDPAVIRGRLPKPADAQRRLFRAFLNPTTGQLIAEDVRLRVTM